MSATPGGIRAWPPTSMDKPLPRHSFESSKVRRESLTSKPVISVEKEAAPPKFVNSLKDQEAKEGEVVSFECEVGRKEPLLFDFYSSGGRLA